MWDRLVIYKDYTEIHGQQNIKFNNVFSFSLYNGNHLGEQDVDGSIILRWIFRKWDVGMWTGSSWLRIGTGGGHL